MNTKINPTGPRWARSKYYRNIFLVIALLAVVTAASVFGNNNAVTDDYTYNDGFDTELYFGMTILRGWPIESILPLDPGLTGYRFSHWASTPNGEAFDFSTPIEYETTFYAIWDGGNSVNYAYDGPYYEYENHYHEYEHHYHEGNDYGLYSYGYDIGNSYYADYDYNAYSYYAPVYEDHSAYYYPAYERTAYYNDASAYDYDYYVGYDYDYYAMYDYHTYDNYTSHNNAPIYFAEEDKLFVRFNWNHENHIEILAQEAAEAARIHEEQMQLNIAPVYADAFGASDEYSSYAPYGDAQMPEIEMFGGYMPIMPFNATVSDIGNLRDQITSRGGNNTPWTIFLNWGTLTTTTENAIVVPAGANVILQSVGAARPIWHQHMAGPTTQFDQWPFPHQRHFRVYGTLTIGNIQLSRASQDPSSTGGGIRVNDGGRLYVNHGGALFQNNRALQGGAIEVMPGGRATVRGGTFTGNVAIGAGQASGGAIRAQGQIGGGPQMAYLTFTRQYPTHISDNHQTASSGGGVSLVNEATLVISGDQPLYITENTAFFNAAGLTAGGHLSISGSGPIIIRDNIAGNDSGGVHFSGPTGLRGYVNISPLTPIDISHNTATNGNGGGLSAIRGGAGFDENINTLRLGENVTITNNIAGNNGGGIYMTGGGIELNNTTITNNTAGINGGGISMISGGSVHSNITSNGATIHSNRASVAVGAPTTANTGGGGVSVDGNVSTFTMNSGTIGHPDATAINAYSNRAIRGAGVRIVSGTFNFNGGSILYNVTTNVEGGTVALANGHGGGVFIEGANAVAANFNMSGAAATDRLIRNNAADLGGGVYLRQGTLRIENENAHIQANTVTTAASGAGVHQVGGLVTMSAGSIRNHNATGTPDGGVSYGSGVDVRGGTFNMSGGAITSNRTGAANMPGGVNVEGAAIFNMTGTGTIGGSAENMWNQGTTGGGVRVAVSDGLVIPPFINIPGGAFNMENGIGEGGTRAISHNRAMDSGGGVHIVSGQFNMRGTAGTSIVSHNQVTGTGATNGGGGVFLEAGHFRMEDTAVSVVEANIVNNANVGAGVHQVGGTVTMSGANTHIRNHNEQGTAAGIGTSHGSGVDIRAGVFNMSAGYISSNRTAAAYRPGGVNIEGTGTFNMSATSTVMLNQGTTGGGVRVNDSTATFNMTGGTIGGLRGCPNNCDNHAIPADCIAADLGNTALSGGGVWVGNGASFDMLPSVNNNALTYSRIIGNNATGPIPTAHGGGGVFVTGASSNVVMQAGVIGGSSDNGEGNIAVAAGGGVYVHTGAELRMESANVTISGASTTTYGRISGNLVTGTTDTHGGGGVFLWATPAIGSILYAHLTIEAGQIGGNSAYGYGNTGQHGGGIFAHTRAKIEISGGRIVGNESIACGGGINLGANIHHNYLEMTGGYIGGASPDLDAPNPFANIAGTDGGGVRVGSLSFFDMYGGHILGNTARANGGGVVVLSEAEFTMHGGTIGSAYYNSWGNSADTGGGVAIGLGWITNNPTAFNFHGGIIGRNTANYGGGVFLNNNIPSNVFNIHGNDPKRITGNTADYGGGVFVGWDTTADHGGQMRMQSGSSNLHITHNAAIQDGGGIFTENHEYAAYLNLPGPYSNLTILSPGITFTGNSALANFAPPSNAVAAGIPNMINSTSHMNPLNNYDINFRGPLPTAQFVFTKTMSNGSTPLGGALFRLDSWNATLGTWVQVPSASQPNGNPVYSNATTGVVAFELSISQTVRYRIVEVTAPEPFQQTIPGYWEISFDRINQFVIQSRGGNLGFHFEGPQRRLMNRLYPEATFEFTKTDNVINPDDGDPVSGIRFYLYEWDETENDWSDTHVYVTTSAATTGLVTIQLPPAANTTTDIPSWAVPGTQFKLREVVPETVSFVQPPGHWIITPTFNYVMQQVEFEIARVLAQTDLPGRIITPNFLLVTQGGASGAMAGLDEYVYYFEDYYVSYIETPAPAPVSGGYIGIVPTVDVFVDNWHDLRQAINSATVPTAITITQSFDTLSVPIIVPPTTPNAEAIIIPGNTHITITSPPGQTHTIIQRHSAAGDAPLEVRHFIVGLDAQPGGTGNNATLVLTNITLSGDPTLTHYHGGVRVNSPNSHLIMNEGASIINCYALDGGGVYLRANNAQFTMNGGLLAHNEAVQRGGGVFQQDITIFNMSGGTIQQNAAQDGGGVHAGTSVAQPAIFNIFGDGLIRDNLSSRFGGGIYLRHHITFGMTGGRISENVTGGDGGGIYIRHTPDTARPTIINITGGYINENTASNDGGGIYTNRRLYNNPLDYNMPSAYRAINIDATASGVAFYGNAARQWFFPPTIINAPTGTRANQLPQIEWEPTTGSSVPNAAGGYHYLLNNYDINFAASAFFWYLGNHPYFEFTKTNNIVNPNQGATLPNARFSLYWRPDSNANWEAVDTTPRSNAQGIVRLPLIAAPGEYRLVETVPPTGFQAPFGHWTITTTRSNDAVAVTGISEHGGNPPFAQHPPLTGSWYVGNRTDIYLPLAGGLGSNHGMMAVTAVGAALVASAGVIAYWRAVKQKRRKLSPVMNRKGLDS